MKDKFINFMKEISVYVIIIVVIILLKIYVVSPIRVNGTSMDPTLENGDIMILNKIGYHFGQIKRFDIVVIKYKDELLIKRVIGLPGETIEYRDNKLYINGRQINDPYPSTETDDFYITDIGLEKIPSDSYFVMGDNRANSLDSRSNEIGVVKKDIIVGRAKLIIWPFNKFGNVK